MFFINNFLKTREKTEISNLYLNRETEMEKIKTNFIYVCFGVEDLYSDFLRVIGQNPNIKTKYDNCYNKILRASIEKLLNNYSQHMEKFKKDPYPFDKYIFQLYFFDFLHQNKSAMKLLNGLVQNKEYYNHFNRELKLLFTNIHNLNFYKKISNLLLTEAFDSMYRKLEGL